MVIGVPLTEICNARIPSRASGSCSRTSSMSARCRRCWTSTPAEIETLLGEQFRGRDKLIAANIHALHMGRDYALAAFAVPDRAAGAARGQGRRPNLHRRQ